jgi:hypothetical protein
MTTRSDPADRMKDSTQNFLLYTPEIEAIRANEQEVSAQISDAMRRISVAIGDQFRHTMRPVHAKSHGLLRAKLSIQGDVPEQYRQGLFAEPGTFDAIVRLSTIPGDILPDNVSSPRGWAIKVIGTPAAAAMLPGHEQHHTQDFLCETGKAFGVQDAEAFLKQILFFEKHATDSPTLKEAVSIAARLAESAIETVGGRIETLKKLGYPQTHILGEFFYSQTPLRYGNYIAKTAFVPASKNLVALKDKKMEHPGNHSALRDAVVRFFKTQRAEWNICAQLATDIEKTPVEDASVVWPEELSPYVTVASLTAERQDAYSTARRIFVDEHLSFSPWHGLLAHQPLGNINRARRFAYHAAAAFRRMQEDRSEIEPTTIHELPI